MDQNILLELEDIFNKISRRSNAQWQQFAEKGLSRSKIHALYRLDQEGRQKIGCLAECLNITTGAMTGISDKLIEEGYAERTRDEEDRRVVYLTISAKGRDELESLMRERRTFLERMLGGLPDEDLSHLRRIYYHILDNLERGGKE